MQPRKNVNKIGDNMTFKHQDTKRCAPVLYVAYRISSNNILIS